jgi:FKBP-type peptidyl-prolyl cis-trans isomerase
MEKKKNKKQGGSAGQNRKVSDDFLKKNGKKAGITISPTGLQYEIIKEGEGDVPDAEANVMVHQRAMLVGGKILDDTYKENTTMEFKLNETIEGYQEALAMIKKGGRIKFFVPPELGWGKKGSGGRIGPNAVVIFDVALVDFW